jgi:prepilin-type N-terminal cleavage/methylation domain-containing protein
MTSIASAFSGTQKTRTPSGTSARGFSLIELMVAMAMACIVLTAVYNLHAALTKSYTTQNAAADAQDAIRAAVDMMAEDIMMAGFDPLLAGSFGIVAASADSIRFTLDRNMDGIKAPGASDLEDIQYYKSGTQLRQQLNGASGGPALDDEFVDNVTALIFTYFDGAGQQMVAPVNPPDIRTIEVKMTVQAPAGRDKIVERAYTTRFRIRNVDL